MSTCQLIAKQPQQSKILLIIITVALPEGSCGESVSILRDWIQMSNRQMGSRSGHAKDKPGALQGFLADTISGGKGCYTRNTFFPSPLVSFFTPLLPLFSLGYLYPHFYLPLPLFCSSVLPSHLSPSFLHPSFFLPSLLPLHFSRLLHLSYLSPFSLSSRSSSPQRSFKLLLHFDGRFLFTLQVKQCN